MYVSQLQGGWTRSPTRADGAKDKGTIASKHVGQYTERRGAREEADVRIGDANSAWHALNAKLCRSKGLALDLRPT